MDEQLVRFRITNLSARVPEGVRIVWQNRECESGPLTLELDDGAPESGNQGLLNYSRGRATAEFHVRLAFPDFASALEDLGVDPEFTEPVRAVLHSEGEILKDHSLVLSGRCALAPHSLLPSDETKATVLPGQ
jgi:hypothetical protein